MNVVILAAGQGKRMHSDLPKVLHPLAGRPLLAHVIATARSLKPGLICVVYGHGGERVREPSTMPIWSGRDRSRSWAPGMRWRRPCRIFIPGFRPWCCTGTCPRSAPKR